jgi:hypothetical protein
VETAWAPPETGPAAETAPEKLQLGLGLEQQAQKTGLEAAEDQRGPQQRQH